MKNYIVKIENDQSCAALLRSIYSQILKQSYYDLSLYVKMPLLKWISAYSLSYILVFIQSIKQLNTHIDIELDLFQDKDIDNVLLSKNSEEVNATSWLRMKQKIIYYESMEFIARLKELSVEVFPKQTRYNKLIEILGAEKEILKNEYSSRILSLRPLIDNEVEQHELTIRMSTLTNILYKNLYNKDLVGFDCYKTSIDAETLKKFSRKIMYELVKNIYQHSSFDSRSNAITSGYACAQTYPIPLIKSSTSGKALTRSLLSFVTGEKIDEDIRYLGITINDWGDGITNRVKQYFKNKLKHAPKEDLCKNLARQVDPHDDLDLLKLAIISDFSSRVDYFISKQSEKEYWTETKKRGELLEPKGFGFIFAVGFLGLTFGKMRVRVGKDELIISAKPEAILEEKSYIWKNSLSTAKILNSELDRYFIIESNALPANQALFPGTQILIEIPVKKFLKKYR